MKRAIKAGQRTGHFDRRRCVSLKQIIQLMLRSASVADDRESLIADGHEQ
jgi:hypothetical protein